MSLKLDLDTYHHELGHVKDYVDRKPQLYDEISSNDHDGWCPGGAGYELCWLRHQLEAQDQETAD
jgi:hypothetical protein